MLPLEHPPFPPNDKHIVYNAEFSVTQEWVKIRGNKNTLKEKSPPKSLIPVAGHISSLQNRIRKHPRSLWNEGVVFKFFWLNVSGARLGNIDLELVVSQGIVVEHADRLIGIRLRGHGYKSEALRQA